ncbi:MAG: hypothetical protein V4548_09040 [Bacteroidota bacterium]
MINSLLKICVVLLFMLLLSCYGVNSETSEIGSINTTCQSKGAWEEITKEYSTDKIQDSNFIEGLNYVKNHFIKPKYILYFENSPREIIGCDYYSVRVAYNPKIFAGDTDGLTPSLSDVEQVRIRNRILKVLYKYECPEGKKILLKKMKEPAIFGKEYYENK